MRPDGTGERKLAKGFLVEGPTWAPNGRLLMFYQQERPTGEGSGDVGLYSVDILGTNLRKVMTPMNASDPAWSPLIP